MCSRYTRFSSQQSKECFFFLILKKALSRLHNRFHEIGIITNVSAYTFETIKENQ